MGDVGCDFCEVADGSRSFRAQAVGLDEDAFLLDPRKKMIGGTSVLDAAEGAVAEEFAADANVCFVLVLNSGHRYGAEFLEFVFSSWEWIRCKDHLFVVGGVA